MKSAVCNLASSEKWYLHCTPTQTSKQWHLEWPPKENAARQLDNERQWGMPAEARTEGTVTWVNLLRNLGPTLFIFRVTYGHVSCCSLWGEADSHIGLLLC